MPLEFVTIPCLSDNYAALVHAPGSGLTALVDAPEAASIEAELDRRGWALNQIWLTHHHADHVQGVEALRARFDCTVVGAAADAHRLPKLDLEVREGTVFSLSREDVQVIEVPGHTLGHVAYYLPASRAVFTADSLMALGCGRLFEGTAQQMWDSLNKLAALPDDTTVYSGHEYTQANARFAETIEPGNAALKRRMADISQARAAGRPTIPSELALEKATNPFLRAKEPEIQANLGMTGRPPVEVFAEIRSRKDQF